MSTLLRRVFPPSIRLQLMTWYTTVFAVLLLVTGAFFYQHLESALEASVDSTLQIRAQQIASELVVINGTLTLHDLTVNPSDPSPQSPSPSLPRGNVDYGELVRLLDAHGKLLSETPAFSALQVPEASLTQPLQGNPWQGTIKAAGGQEIRIYSRAFTNQGRALAVIQVGESLTSLHTLLHELIAELLVAGALALLVCAMGSYWLAARSFAPIQRLAHTARQIQAGDLHQRVPVPPALDEMQYLALTLNAMLDSLDQSFARQRRFVADASHELRTPLAVIRNKADVALLHPRTQQEYEAVLQSIVAETGRLSHLLSDLLALARGDEGQALIEYEPVRLDHLVESVAANAMELARERGILLTVRASQPVTVIGDGARLIQVIMNLLDNAIRYTDSGGLVLLNLQATSSEARLIVQDTGVGIAPEHLPHIFERFYRGDQARQKATRGGNGLGLAIVDWTVRVHHGTITVTSLVGQGSMFTITLPAMPPALPAATKTSCEDQFSRTQ